MCSSDLKNQALANIRQKDELKKVAGIKSLLENRQFRDFAWDFLEFCGIFHDGFNENSNKMAFSSGKRAAGLKFFDLLAQAEPAIFARLQKEHAKEINNFQQRIDAEYEKLIDSED